MLVWNTHKESNNKTNTEPVEVGAPGMIKKGPNKCYRIAEWFFVNYILSFSLVRLWTIRLLVQVFTLARRGYDNHKYHNKNPREENETGVWMTSCPEAISWEFWWFLKKAVNWDLTQDEASWDFDSGPGSPAGGYRMHSVFVGSESWELTLGRESPAGGWLWVM